MKNENIKAGKVFGFLGWCCILFGVIGFLFSDGKEMYQPGKMVLLGIPVLLFGKYLQTGFPNTYICRSCLKVSYIKQTKKNKCPLCNSEVEPLKGFYDRHPDLKNKS
jgi:hypothetical protein